MLSALSTRRVLGLGLAACLIPLAAHAAWFKNNEQVASEIFQHGAYEEAARSFGDDYRQGVALYRAGKYLEAANRFARVEREEVSLDARYNLGNAQFMTGNYQEAIQAYKTVLEQRPTDGDARHNLALARAMLQKLGIEEKPEEKQPPEAEKTRAEKAKQEKQQQDQKQRVCRTKLRFMMGSHTPL